MKPEFKSSFAENIFRHKYALTQAQTWWEMKVSKDRRYVWCSLNDKDFPIMCKQYRGQHG